MGRQSERSELISQKYPPIKKIGIPRALLYFRYGVLWRSFFEALGIEVVLSPKTDRALVERGSSLSVDECCLASKVFLGHVDYLVRYVRNAQITAK